MARTAADVLESHGFGGERLLKLSRKIANDELRRRGAFLDSARLEDLVGFLALAGVRAALRYDSTRTHASYGRDGGDPFASWMADLLAHRVVDWYRTKAEGWGDTRRGHNDRIVLSGNRIEDERGADPFVRELALRRIESGEEMDEAEAAFAERYALSEDARYGLHLIRLKGRGPSPAWEGHDDRAAESARGDPVVLAGQIGRTMQMTTQPFPMTSRPTCGSRSVGLEAHRLN